MIIKNKKNIMNTLNSYKTANYNTLKEKGSFTFSAPSNIALVKYRGKKENQIPANPSLSFTLNHCKTITTLQFEPKSKKGISFDSLFEGQPRGSFRGDMREYLGRIQDLGPYVVDCHFTVDTRDTFPHRAGIAASAAGMAALSANLIAL